jgi:hypothetical protein
MRRLAATLTVIELFGAALGAQRGPAKVELPSIAPLVLSAILDAYAAGHFDDAVGQISRAGDTVGRNLRRHWPVEAAAWIAADPSPQAERRLAAAALALETEHIRVERGEWGTTTRSSCGGPCVLDWAQAQLVERGAPDAAERAWYLAAASLVGGVRDWRYLERPANPRADPPIQAGLMDRAVDRVPADAAVRLEQALAAVSRFSVTTDGDRSSASPLPPALANRGFALALSRPSSREAAQAMMAALVDDPIVGAEARVRLGYLLWTTGDDAAADAQLSRAAADTSDADLRYLAEFLGGWTAMTRGDSAAAVPHLEAAIAARPDSQSAAVALSALALQRGDAMRADALARAALDGRPGDVDPWRAFLYGHYPRWPQLLAELRRQVHP